MSLSSSTLEQRVVVCEGKQTHLTQNQAKLLEMFLRAPGKVISRATLIKHVWRTDYLGDTRTLDVHINWLRRIIEADPRHSRYLKTVRNVGYWLAVE